MATVREVIIPQEKKKDGTWNVKIRVNHNGQTLYIKTRHFVVQKQLKSDFSIKDPIIALSHKDQTKSVTDIYIAKSWKIVDEVQAAVIDLLCK